MDQDLSALDRARRAAPDDRRGRAEAARALCRSDRRAEAWSLIEAGEDAIRDPACLEPFLDRPAELADLLSGAAPATRVGVLEVLLALGPRGHEAVLAFNQGGPKARGEVDAALEAQGIDPGAIRQTEDLRALAEECPLVLTAGLLSLMNGAERHRRAFRALTQGLEGARGALARAWAARRVFDDDQEPERRA